MPDSKDHSTAREDEPLVYGAVAVIIAEGRFLTIRRSLTVAAPGAVCFPGGGIEAGEDSRAAVIRELQEELTIRVAPLQQLWTSVTSWNVHLTWWQCGVEDIESIRLDKKEVAEFRWATPQELRSNPDLLESNHHFLDAWESGEFTIEGFSPRS